MHSLRAAPSQCAVAVRRASHPVRSRRLQRAAAAMSEAVDPAVAAVVALADDLHKQAAALNKAGKFDDAKAMYARYQAALSQADAAASTDDGAAMTRLAAAAAAAVVRRPARFAQLPASAGGAAAVRARVVGAVVGAACADAASMSTHWVYEMAALGAMVAGRDAAFLDPPADAFYSYPLGSPSPYGQQARALLSSLVDARGFSPEAYAARNFEVFGAPSFAASGGYLDGSTAGFVRAVRSGASWPRCGVDDAQANCIARLPPLVAAFAGDAALLPTVADMIRTTQDSPAAVAWGAAAARVLEAVILGAPPAQAVQAAIAAMQDPARAFRTEQDAEVAAAMAAAAAMAGAPHADAVTQLGRNCHLPGALQSPVHALVAVRSPAAGMNEYQAAVMDTILQGGCNASRAGFVGACFGAHVGAGAVPPAWRAKFLLYEETLARAEALADMRA